MPLDTVHGEPPAEGPAAPHLDGVADRPSRWRARPRRTRSMRSLRALRVSITRLVPSTDGSFLVARDEERDRALVIRMLTGRTPLSRGHHRGEAALHVRARRARRARRRARTGRTDLTSTLRAGRWAPRRCGRRSTAAVRLSPRRAHRFSTSPVAQSLDAETDGFEPAGHDILTSLIGRRYGTAGHEVLGELERRGHWAEAPSGGWCGRGGWKVARLYGARTRSASAVQRVDVHSSARLSHKRNTNEPQLNQKLVADCVCASNVTVTIGS